MSEAYDAASAATSAAIALNAAEIAEAARGNASESAATAIAQAILAAAKALAAALSAENANDYMQAARAYAEAAGNAAAAARLWSDRGSWDASAGLYPEAGGSGLDGEIVIGDIWTITNTDPVELGGEMVSKGDMIRALVDEPGQTPANWATMEGNIGYVPLNAAQDLADLHDAAAALTNLGAQAASDKLAAIVAASWAANKLIYLTAADTVAVTDFPAFARTLVAASSASTARTALGLGSAATASTGAFATAAQGGKADSALQSVGAGDNVKVNVTDPRNPIISASGGIPVYGGALM